MSAAIVDVLVATGDPRCGCSLRCSAVKWDDITSSEQAFYRATKAAMISLHDRDWSLA